MSGVAVPVVHVVDVIAVLHRLVAAALAVSMLGDGMLCLGVPGLGILAHYWNLSLDSDEWTSASATM